MNKQEENRYSMYRAVEQVLSDHQEAVTALPALAESADNLRQTMGEISQQDNRYKTITGGATDAKNVAEEALIETMIRLSSALYVFGRKEGDMHLQSVSNFSESDLRRMRDSDLIQKGRNLLETLQGNQTQLGNFGVTAEMVSEYADTLSQYEGTLGVKDSRFAESRAARLKLSELFNQASAILKEELDQLMELIRKSDKGIYNQYVAARVIRDL